MNKKEIAKRLLSSRNAILPTTKELDLIESGVHPELAHIVVDVMDQPAISEDEINEILKETT